MRWLRQSHPTEVQNALGFFHAFPISMTGNVLDRCLIHLIVSWWVLVELKDGSTLSVRIVLRKHIKSHEALFMSWLPYLSDVWARHLKVKVYEALGLLLRHQWSVRRIRCWVVLLGALMQRHSIHHLLFLLLHTRPDQEQVSRHRSPFLHELGKIDISAWWLLGFYCRIL